MLIPRKRKDRDAMLQRGSPYRGMLRAVAKRLGKTQSLAGKVFHGSGKSAEMRAAIEEEIMKRSTEEYITRRLND